MASIQERTTKKGEKKYQVIVRRKGHPPQVATFKRRTDAVRWATQIEAAILEGRHFATSAAKKRSFAEAVNRYTDRVVPVRYVDPIANKAVRRHLTWWMDRIGHISLCQITAEMISDNRDLLRSLPVLDSLGRPLVDESGNVRRAKSAATVNRYLASLSAMFTTIVREWGWVEQNPASKVSRLREEPGRVRFLSDEERDRLLKACKASSNKCLFTIVVVALSTAARKSEIMNLRWRDIDLDRGIARLEKTKNRERRALPLTHVALDLIRARYKEGKTKADHFVFPNSEGDRPMFIEQHWLSALESADIEDFRFHDLRHSAASSLAMNGATLAEIAEILGHKTLQMVKRYAHLSEQHTADVVERMNRKIFADNDDEIVQPSNRKGDKKS